MGKTKTVAKRQRHQTDWPGLRMLFATGTTQEELAKQTGIPLGTICSRCARENWDADRQRVKELASSAQAKTQELLATMPERGKRWVSRVAEQTDKHLSIIEQEEVSTLKDVDRVISTLNKVDRVARRSYGLDEEGSGNKTIVNLGFLQDYSPEIVKAEVVSDQASLDSSAEPQSTALLASE